MYNRKKRIPKVAKMQPLSNPDPGQSVLRALEETVQLDLRDVSVKTDDDVVTVSGLVRSRVAKDAVERAFEQVSGLRAIASDLEIKPLPERTDTEIAKGILRAFQSHAIMTADDVRIIVSKKPGKAGGINALAVREAARRGGSERGARCPRYREQHRG
jgi:hypothetical protein